MKKCLCIGLCFLLVLLCGCTPKEKAKSLSVVATIFPYYDFAREIAGEKAEVSMLISPGGEVHGYEPTLEDLTLVQNCDVFLYNGGEGDGWVETLLANCDTSKKQVVRLMDFVELLAVGEEHHHQDHQHSHEEADEHIFTTPENALLLANAIGNALVKASAENEEYFLNNYKTLQENLLTLKKDYAVLQGATLPLIVADRFPFLYVTTQYSLSYVAAFSGCSANTEADLKTVYHLKTQAARQQNPVILCTEFSDGKLANTVAEAVKGKVARLHSCHNVTAGEWEQQVTYIWLMQQNLKVLREVLEL